MRSTFTATRETTLHWERTHGAHAGAESQYGDWRFRAYAWQPGSYFAIAHNTATGETREAGHQRGELRTLAAAKQFCEAVYQKARREDLVRGIERG